MDLSSNTIGRIIDSAIYITLGVCWVLLLPEQVQRAIDAGKVSKDKAQIAKKLKWPIGLLIIGYGFFKFFFPY